MKDLEQKEIKPTEGTGNAPSDKIEKEIPSPIEHAVYHLLYNYVGPHIPKQVTPNQITAFGAVFCLIGVICSFLARIHTLFLIGSVMGLVVHLICDDLDGYVARTRNMTSKAGAYFDLLTDVLHITFLLIGMSYAHVVKFQVAIWMVPLYALIIMTAMNSILYLKVFPFPRTGPIETHIVFVAVCIVTMIFGTENRLTVFGFDLNIVDLIFIIGMIPMYVEMIRLQISLLVKLSKKDAEERKARE